MLDFLIKNGHVVDPAAGVDRIADLGISNGRMVEVRDGDGDAAAYVVDASGYYVCPGLIDAHSHVFYAGSGLGVHPDLLLATGVTTVVDAGSAGWANYGAFHSTAVDNSLCRIFSLVGYNASGQVALGYREDYDGGRATADRIRRLLDRYPGEILGLKLRLQLEVVGEDGLRYLEAVQEVAEEVGCRVVVHTTHPPVHGGAIASLLRPGDVYSHCFQGTGRTILDGSGHVCREVWDARKRGVIFEAANGTGNFAFSTAKAALSDGFLPDIIAADTATNSFGLPFYATNLPFVLSKYLHLGMTLSQVIACATSIPARVLGLGGLGTLIPGTPADVAVFRLEKREVTFWDSGKTVETQEIGHEILVPKMTWREGQVVFHANDF